MHRFIRREFNLDQERLTITDRRLVHQINNVLRMDSGDKIQLCDGAGREADGRIIEIDPQKGVVVKVLNTFRNQNEPERNITLYCSILKHKNFDLVVEKCTELGVSKIVPILAERTVKTGLKRQRLKKKMREAAEQCSRAVLPELSEKMSLSEAIDRAGSNEVNILYTLQAKKYDQPIKAKNLGVFIGSEGGWTDKEIERFKQQEGFIEDSLGSLTLRAETAAIVGVYSVT